MPEDFSQLLALPIQAHLAVHIQIQSALGGMDGSTQFLPFFQDGHEEGSHFVSMACVLTGSDFLHHRVWASPMTLLLRCVVLTLTMFRRS